MLGLIRIFARHPVAPNLAMLVMVMAGLWAGAQLTRQLLPTFALNFVTVDVVWPGASASDVEALITQPLEDELLGLDDLRSVRSTSRDGLAQITLEYPESADMIEAQGEVKDLVAQVTNLPLTAEEPRVSTISRNEPVSKFVVTGPVLAELRPLVRNFERQLRSRGLARLEIVGLPKEEISIEVPGEQLSDLGLSLAEIADRVRGSSFDTPAGTVGETDVARQLRSLDQRRSAEEFANLPVAADQAGQLLKLGDIAEVRRVPVDEQPILLVNKRPAVEISVARSEQEDSLRIAERLSSWIDSARDDLPPNVEIITFNETWRLVNERINLMITNAASGLLLVVVILYVFLNGRVALWVAVGIPVSILAAMMALYLFGGTINVMSLFAFIMTFGIIVDDAIVVAEEAVTLYQSGSGPVGAAERAAQRMFAPVTAASLTTVAAFLPLVTIGGTTGNILFAIPLVVVCVVLASLLECFIVLPGHLRHALEKTSEHKEGRMHRYVNRLFRQFRDGAYRSAVSWSVANRGTTISIGVAGLILVVGLMGGGRVGFAFFPQPDGTTLTADVRFTAGSPPERVDKFMKGLGHRLNAAEESFGEDLVVMVVTKLRQDSGGQTGTQVAHMIVELLPGDARNTTNRELIRAWRNRVSTPPGLESLRITSSRGGPPGADIELQLTQKSADVLKDAALEFQDILAEFPGVGGISDDTTFGKEELIFEVSSTGQALGLTSRDLGEQLRATFEGELIQSFQDQGEEVEVRIRLAGAERETLRALETLPVVLPAGGTAVLANVANLSYGRGFDTLRHSNGQLAVTVTANVDPRLNNANALRGRLARDVLPRLSDDYGVAWQFKGDAENQAESVGDITLALPLALLMIYIILAWVFASYTWPFAVLLVIPFGLVGAVFGHWLLGFDVTMLSVFGFFGLSGIVINDSIILVTVFKELREKAVSAAEAAIKASCKRLRAVLLTSVTTVVGIMPLLAEQARQAQFLKPMVISISFGLIFGTLIVLFLVPAILVSLEALKTKLAAVRSGVVQLGRRLSPAGVLAAGTPHSMTGDDPAVYRPDRKSSP